MNSMLQIAQTLGQHVDAQRLQRYFTPLLDVIAALRTSLLVTKSLTNNHLS